MPEGMDTADAAMVELHNLALSEYAAEASQRLSDPRAKIARLELELQDARAELEVSRILSRCSGPPLGRTSPSLSWICRRAVTLVMPPIQCAA